MLSVPQEVTRVNNINWFSSFVFSLSSPSQAIISFDFRVIGLPDRLAQIEDCISY